jgi:RNA polymerase sigma-70 factor, ECF subfamily
MNADVKNGQDLIERLKKKETAALNEVMAMYKNQIFNYLKLMTGNIELAEEITQDTFVKVYFKAHTLRTDNLKAWIYKIATNLARSEFRKIKIKHLLSLADVNESHVSYHPTPGQELELEQVLAVLPDKYRTVLIMKEINNFSLEEIAVILKKPVGTIKSLMFRGLQMVRFHFQTALSNGGNHG